MKKILFIVLTILGCSLFGQKHMMHDFYYYINPDHGSKVYKNILIVSNMDRVTLKRVRKSARKMHYNVTFYNELFPPIKEYTDEEIASRCAREGIDGILYYTYIGKEVTGTKTTRYGTVLNQQNVNVINGYSFSENLNYYSMELYFVDINNQDVKEYIVTGGYGPKYSYHVGSALFMRSLKILKKRKIALPSN